MKFKVFVEFAIRLILWGIFLHFDKAVPFIRHIHPNEAWLYSYPNVNSYVPSTELWWFIIGVPFLFLISEYIFGVNKADVIKAFWGLSLSFVLTGAITALIKVLVGRPRPSFIARCFPDGGSGQDLNKCIGTERSITDARKSFPSAHSSFSFTCMVFLSLYLARKFIYRKKSQDSWKLLICLMPIVAACCIAISRTCDYHHHYEDVIVGSMLGTGIAWVVFHFYFTEAEKMDSFFNPSINSAMSN